MTAPREPAATGAAAARSAGARSAGARSGGARLAGTARSRRGFSLVEVLAALAATVLIIGAFSPFAAQLVASWGRGARTAEFVDMATTATARLTRDIASAVPMLIVREEGSSMLFRGDANYVLFPAATGFGAGRGGFELVSIAIEPADGRTALVRRRAPLGANPDERGFRDAVVLLEGRYRMRFAFRDRASGTLRPEWRDRPEMPVSVELTLVDADGKPVFPAPLVFSIPANYPASCISDEAPEACADLYNEAPSADPGGAPSDDDASSSKNG